MIGNSYPIIINCNIGINSTTDYLNEIKKIDLLFRDISTRPHTMMDLSICKNSPSLAKYIIDTYDIPVGIVPSYLSFIPNKGIEKSVLINHIIKNAEDGVAFMTMHFTSDWDIYQEAKRDRKIPV
ncbi:MAG: phosphomethylpyrimidine synthase ThiC, partial [Parabacteroides sp.]|nr:phosphomethylpyrimidine synthase ThiC [Parabacteroides sp.]